MIVAFFSAVLQVVQFLVHLPFWLLRNAQITFLNRVRFTTQLPWALLFPGPDRLGQLDQIGASWRNWLVISLPPLVWPWEFCWMHPWVTSEICTSMRNLHIVVLVQGHYKKYRYKLLRSHMVITLATIYLSTDLRFMLRWISSWFHECHCTESPKPFRECLCTETHPWIGPEICTSARRCSDPMAIAQMFRIHKKQSG
jgi:hypothetical protein